MFSGYLDTTKPERKLHYMFLPSQNDPTKDPLVVWLNGGPGCSSLGGFITEHGPALFNDYDTELKLNEFSWNKKANMIYIESPAGVGFSYSTLGVKDLITNDEMSAQDNLQALLSFRKKFPEYESNDFYLSGESYAGIYVPQLATKVLEDGTFKTFRGILIGNGCTDWNYDLEHSLVEFAHDHYIYPKKVLDDYKNNCITEAYSPLQRIEISDNCLKAKKQVKESLEGLNIYDIYRPCPKDPTDTSNTSSMATFNVLINKVIKKQKEIIYGESKAPLDLSIWPSHCSDNHAIAAYFNQDAVKDALHVKKDITWANCNPDISSTYDVDTRGSIYLYPNIMKNNIRILFYTGDTDAAVVFKGSIKWIRDLNLPIKTPYRSWIVNDQVAGFTQEYEGLTYTTIKGTGHMAPGWKKEESFIMFNNFISGQ